MRGGRKAAEHRRLRRRRPKAVVDVREHRATMGEPSESLPSPPKSRTRSRTDAGAVAVADADADAGADADADADAGAGAGAGAGVAPTTALARPERYGANR